MASSINQIKTKTLSSIFTPEEVQSLINLLSSDFAYDKNNNKHYLKSSMETNKANGRSRYDLKRYMDDYNVIPENILNKAIWIASNQYGKNLKIHNVYSTTYSLEHGFPNLHPHKDNSGAVCILDYQLGGNIQWEISVEEESFALKNNDALITDVCNNLHWREPRKFSAGEFLTMVYFLFYDPEVEVNYRTPEEVDNSYTELDRERRKLYNKRLSIIKKQYDEEKNDNSRND